MKKTKNFTRVRFHIVFSTCGREPLLTPEIEAVLYPYLTRRAEYHGAKLVAANGWIDHVHLILGVRLGSDLPKLIGKLKCESSAHLNRQFPGLELRWQRGYGAFSLSAWNLDGPVAYVNNQKHHHTNKTTYRFFELTHQLDDDF